MGGVWRKNRDKLSLIAHGKDKKMFTGYSDKTIDFMWGIRLNNNREWFAAHKQDYIENLYTPTVELGKEVYDKFTEKYPKLNLNLHICRIYRDARRLYGHGPYKDHLWLTIRPDHDIWSQQPVFWFEITPDEWSYGVGFWNAGAATMAAMRRDMDEDPRRAEKLVRKLKKDGRFSVYGEDYARKKGETTPLLTEWYNKKGISLGCYRPLDETLYTHDLAETLLDGFCFLEPYYRYFKGFCKTGLEDLK